MLDGGAYQGGELRAIVVENGKHRIEAVRSKDYQNKDKHEAHMPVSARDELVDQGLLRCDDKGDLRIYTYTDDCMYSGAWNDITMHSRGIILNRNTGEVTARPFSKFFNIGEKEETMEKVLPWSQPYMVFEKLDGWLGTLYRYDGEYCIATRGSFDGMGMGTWATDYLQKNHDLTDLPDEVTLVFELICPQTHIIVDYKGEEKIVLLAAFNRHTGEEYAWDQVLAWGREFKFPIPRVFRDGINGCKEILAAHPGNKMEGFVIRFWNGLRVKVKSKDYKRRAAIVSNMTPLALWRAIQDAICNKEYKGDPFKKLVAIRDTVDADYIDQFDELVEELSTAFHSVMSEIDRDFETVAEFTDNRKKFALAVKAKKLTHTSAMFSLLDEKLQAVDKYVVKVIRPTNII